MVTAMVYAVWIAMAAGTAARVAVRQLRLSEPTAAPSELPSPGTRTRDADLMLRPVMAALEHQRPYVRSNARRAKTFRAGLSFWQRYYGRMLVDGLAAGIGSRRWRRARRDLITLLWYYPWGVFGVAGLGLARVRSVARRATWAPPLVFGQARPPSQASAPEGAPR